ncbi:hypothetical protein [Commensalibacter papalotli (ex Servin-Garciduenas et al. 2014)]|nr:hypothetical protein [Commensalibacter papalotli (ex Servin-Garciduenas et al. 2014)]
MMIIKRYSCILLLSIFTGLVTNQTAFAQPHLECYAYVTEMVRSSNFPVHEVGKDKINLLIDDDQPNMISAQVVYDVISQPDNPNTSVAIGWIKYDVNKHILWNNSADLNEHRVQLTYNKKYAVGFDQCHKKHR